MERKLQNLKTTGKRGHRLVSWLLVFALVLSMTLQTVTIVQAGVSMEHPFTGGQQIFLDASTYAQNWSEDYYPYMYLFNDNPNPHVRCWVRMTEVECQDRRIFTGTIPDDGNSYCGLIFTSQSSDVGDWNHRVIQTVDIVWDGESNCYTFGSYNGSANVTGSWTGTFSEDIVIVTETEGAYAISTDGVGCSITAKAEGRKKGTADAGDTVTVKVTVDSGYTLDAVTVTGKSKTKYEVTPAGEGEYVFTMPEEKVTVSAKLLFDKSKAFSGDVLWVDTQPEIQDSAIGLVKWTNRQGPSGNSGNTYTLYLPGGVDLSNLPVYYGNGGLSIDGNTVSQGQICSFAEGHTYQVNGHSMKIMQSDSASVYLQTKKDLPYTPYGSVIDKETTRQTDGQFMSVGKNGKIVDAPQVLAQIKGRGNSSWEASCKMFGKYAYNIKLDKKTDVLKMGAVKAKSFCLLANNMDESLLRNLEIYQAAAMAGMAYVPHYEVVDAYNNGEYLGSYLITEKVDVGGSKLVQGETVEDYHNDSNATGNLKSASYTYLGGSYRFQYADIGGIDEGVDFTKKSYLLEFDLRERAQAENCWFVTPKGQYIAVKSPDDLNEAEMRFIIGKWAEAEDAVYNGNETLMRSMLDLSSFADVYLIQEFTKNLDSCATSYYVYYDGTKESVKWQATPIWDYDWALGGYQNGRNIISKGDSEANNNPVNTSGWFARYKASDTNSSIWNFQAQLANNSMFWEEYVVKSWTFRLYDALKNVFGTRISTDYQAHQKSFAMNEARYGFITRNLISGWGSKDTGNTPQETFEYLKNWSLQRLDWMGSRINSSYLAGYSLSLDGEIGVNFYMELDYGMMYSDTAYMQFTVPSGEGTLPPEETRVYVIPGEGRTAATTVTMNQKIYYVFQCRVDAKEMTSEIKAQLMDGKGGQGRVYTYTVKDYADYLLAHPEIEEYAKAAKLVKSMLNYGTAAQTYFGTNPDSPANERLSENDKKLGDVTFSHEHERQIILPECVSLEGFSLSLKSETTLSFIFKSTDGDAVSFRYDGREITPVEKNGYLQVNIAGIKADRLSSDFTLSVGENGSVTFGPMDYCRQVLQETDKDDLKDVVKALVLYSQAADEYIKA